MSLLFHLSVVVLSFRALTRLCDGHFIPSLDRIARRYKISHDAAGATLMAVGSSSAELFIAIIALMKPGDHADLGIGTIVGSALFNILAIVGAAAVARNIHLSWHKSIRDLGFYALSIILLFISFRDGVINIPEALSFIILYFLYVMAVINWKKFAGKHLKSFEKDIDIPEKISERMKEAQNFSVRIYERVMDFIFPKNHYILVFFLSIISIALLSWILVESAVAISEILQVPEIIIGLTILAIGSSVPDLISSIIVSKQGRGEMAISNAIGSNVFDILFGLGFPWILYMLINGKEIHVNNQGLELSVILLFASIFVVIGIAAARKWHIGKRCGITLVTLYMAYLTWVVVSNITMPAIL